ncbi:phage scaffolding protein [Chengkuizengella sp. SCS-71B]|uniref:phage scaffolding protein n=1 Tax=Chengkuizengella sp. SCS-71B TaxID=3115290 RepID=UPI0032C235A9
MDWLKNLLKGMNLSEEQIKSIVERVEGNYKDHIPKHRFDEVNTAKKQLETDIKDRDKQLTELKKNAGDKETLTNQIEQLQKENKKKDQEYKDQLKDMSVTTAIKLAVNGKVHDPDLITSLLDKSKIEINEDGSVKTGLDDQIKALQESKAFLFVQEEGNENKFKGATPPEGKDKDKNDPNTSVGASFAKTANDSGKEQENNFWD